MKTTDVSMRLALIVSLAFAVGGCGLKDDLYIPVEEPDASAEDEPDEESPAPAEQNP